MLRLDTTSKGWGLLPGHQRGLPNGHLRGLSHGHGQRVLARLLHRFSMFPQSNRHSSATEFRTPKGPPAGSTPPRGSCASAHFTTKGIAHEASSHPSRDDYGGRYGLAVRIRRIGCGAHPRSHFWSARLQLCKDDGILRDAQPLSHARWHDRDGNRHDECAHCLTRRSSDR